LTQAFGGWINRGESVFQSGCCTAENPVLGVDDLKTFSPKPDLAETAYPDTRLQALLLISGEVKET
jgi:hypothetical protein